MSEIDFYRNIGYLTYAIATSDNSIPKVRIKFMKNELLKLWFLLDDTDIEEDSDSLIQIELIFNWLLSHSLSSHFALNCFTDFVTKNPLTDIYKEKLILYSKQVALKLYTLEESETIVRPIYQILGK